MSLVSFDRLLRKRRPRWLRAIIPILLFLAPLGGGGALAVAAQAKSPALIALAAVGFVASFIGLTTWIFRSERLARKPPGHVPWPEDDWRDFERSFWAEVTRRSNHPPPDAR